MFVLLSISWADFNVSPDMFWMSTRAELDRCRELSQRTHLRQLCHTHSLDWNLNRCLEVFYWAFLCHQCNMFRPQKGCISVVVRKSEHWSSAGGMQVWVLCGLCAVLHHTLIFMMSLKDQCVRVSMAHQVSQKIRCLRSRSKLPSFKFLRVRSHKCAMPEPVALLWISREESGDPSNGKLTGSQSHSVRRQRFQSVSLTTWGMKSLVSLTTWGMKGSVSLRSHTEWHERLILSQSVIYHIECTQWSHCSKCDIVWYITLSVQSVIYYIECTQWSHCFGRLKLGISTPDVRKLQYARKPSMTAQKATPQKCGICHRKDTVWSQKWRWTRV